jgi:serpin B
MKKRLLLFIISFVFIIGSILQAQQLGDVNNDGQIDIIDALKVAQYYVGLASDETGMEKADVDGNGSIDIIDALLIAQYYVGLITSFPAEDGIEIVGSSLQRNMNPQLEQGELESVVEGNNLFAFDCYAKIKETADNVFFSPISISIAFGMCYAGANGNTETQIASTMHFSLPEERLHNAFNSLEITLTEENPDPPEYAGEDLKLHIANSTWGQKDYYFVPEFLDILALHYGAEMNTVDFAGNPEACRLLINDWVYEKTEEKIEDLLPQGSIDSLTRLVLTNAIYFKATWLNPFDENNTRDGTFYHLDGSTATVPMMYQSAILGYGEVPGEYKAVKLPYQGTKETSMIIILPDQGTFEGFENSFTKTTYDTIIASMGSYMVDITMPKFSYEWGESLKTYLQSLGMTDAFIDGLADFSGINGLYTLVITDVFHKAFVAVDEKGTEAAAATAIVFGETAVPESAEIVIDRPFLFFIQHDDTGTILFMGKVGTP